MANIEGNTTYGAAYHGYWPVNYNALNSHFGTDADLKALSDALHKRGMYLMVLNFPLIRRLDSLN